MSGLVPMHEYRRVVEKCERLEEELAWLRGEDREDDGAERVVALKIALGIPARVARLLLCLDASPSDKVVRFVRLEEAGPYTPGSARMQMFRLRERLEDIGAPRDIITTVWGVGYRLTETGRRWLRQHVPDAFPATKEPSR